MKNKTAKNIVITAMMLAIGLVLPFFTGQLKSIGNMLLPMHVPVFLCGLICSWKYGLVLGLTLPLVRSFLFSMPALYPSALAMAFELCTYGFISGLLFGRTRHKCLVSLYRCLILAMLAGRAVWGVAMTVLLGLGKDGFTFAAFVSGAFLTAIPGIAIQLLLIPAVMLALGKTHLVPMHKLKSEDNANAAK